MLSRLKFKIEPLVDEILNKIPEPLWTSKTSTFLDPAMGGGQFVSAIEAKLRKYGHSDNNIAKRVFGCEEHERSVKFAIGKHNLIGTYYACNFLEEDWDMKFNVILGNPPYNIGMTQHKYIDFVTKAITSHNANFLSFIIPTAWTYSSRFTNFQKFLKDNGLYQIRFINRSEFLGIIQDVCIIYVNSNLHKNIKIVSKGGDEYTYPISQTNLMPASSFIAEKIVNTLRTADHLTILNGENKTVRHHGNRIFNDYISERKSELHSHKLISRLGGDKTKNEILWISDKISNPVYKVVTARLQPSTGKISYWQVANKNDAISESLMYVSLNTQNEAEQCKKYLNSNIIKFIFREVMQTARMSKSLLSNIPSIDLTRTWTDAELYKHFNLTQEEIDYVEANIK